MDSWQSMCSTPACLFPAGSEPWSPVRGTFHYSQTLPECSGWHSSQGQSQPSVATPAASQHPPGSTPGSLLSRSLPLFWCLSAFSDFCLLPLGLFSFSGSLPVKLINALSIHTVHSAIQTPLAGNGSADTPGLFICSTLGLSAIFQGVRRKL